LIGPWACGAVAEQGAATQEISRNVRKAAEANRSTAWQFP
jgi:hypothetical protein